MSNLYDNLEDFYSISKTLSFELKPVGNTLKNIEESDTLNIDTKRSESFKKVKKYCDEYHKVFIDKCLSDVHLDSYNEYLDCIHDCSTSTDKEKIDLYLTKLRNDISLIFTKDHKEEYDKLFGKDLVTEILPKMFAEDSEKMDDINMFAKFSSYFSSYYKNRKNMYTNNDISSSIVHRIVDENMPIYLSNVKIFNNYFTDELKDSISGVGLDTCDIFYENNFLSFLSQGAIDKYNELLSGYSLDDKTKIKGLNEYINEYNQTHEKRVPKLTKLYKQILSDSISSSFKYEIIENDQELVELLDESYNSISNLLDEESSNSFANSLKKLSNSNYNLNLIYISSKYINKLSNDLLNDFSKLNSLIMDDYDKNDDSKNKNSEKYYEKRRKDLKKNEYYSIDYLNNLIINSNLDKSIINYFSSYISTNKLLDNLKEKYNLLKIALRENDELTNRIITNDSLVTKIKDYLDSYKAVFDFYSVFNMDFIKVENKDDLFYENFISNYEVFSLIIPIYNKTRNYLTKKRYSNEKIKLNFSNPTLLSGWDLSKENDNCGIILRKGSNYYVGILNKGKGLKLSDYHDTYIDGDYYEKMDYKLLPTPNKMLPKVFFSKKGLSNYKPSDYILSNYNAGIFKKGEGFDLNYCHDLIRFYIDCIRKNDDWKIFNFKFKDADQYNDISEFYSDVEDQGFSLSFNKYSVKVIDDFVNSGRLNLFQIYNKDFSKYSKGTPNLFTMYWKALFTDFNIENNLIKLNGNAEVFYRKKSLSLKNTTIHEANKAILNKSEYNKENKPETTLPYDVIKDRRYTVDKFQFHVPISINFINRNINNINPIVNKYIRDNNDDVNILGIDRGERNLLYISIINHNGEILHQESMNIINNEYKGNLYSINYNKLLGKQVETMDVQKKSWKSIGNIKDLKNGYMSLAVHHICDLMIKYNAIVVIEDLNHGFMNSRIKVEKQVYQKFESMFITKLNYLVSKNEDPYKLGGLYRGYQLTNKFETFNKIGKQTGVLYYIPAWCTSKIDPTTGFVNLFSLKYENAEKTREFINNIDNIVFNKKDNYFEFVIDYDNFNNCKHIGKSNWVLCSYGPRIINFKNKDKNGNWDNKEIDLTKEFNDLFNAYNVDINNIKSSIMNINEAKFFEQFTYLFKSLVQMRNSITNSDVDYIISPVKNSNGEFFDTRLEKTNYPLDADANGAYNIAKKGLMLTRQIKNCNDDDLYRIKYDISNAEWLDFAQSNGIK